MTKTRVQKPGVRLPNNPKSLATSSQLLSQKELIQAKAQEARDGLPHLYGFKWYPWARRFFESTNSMNLLCAANQISKSSTQIRKCIDWATNTKKWTTLWPDRQPRMFWYFYPSDEVATIEFQKKWIPEFLPRHTYRNHPTYGWTEDYDKKMITAIHFNSGVSVYFKTYSQKAVNLQTGTVDAVFADEELPEDYYDEINARLFRTKGYFHLVFTATLCQELWYRAIEATGTQEKFPDAFKQQISMYDCMYYDDGTPSLWTEEEIKRIIASCKSEAEVQRRVFGRFIKDTGRKYPTFSRNKHYTKDAPPKEWNRYGAADIGSGNEGHPGAIVFVAVNPTYTKGIVYRAWRGDSLTTTAGDILNKYVELRGFEHHVGQYYDFGSKDFGTIADTMGEPFEKAEKSHDIGENVINTLFKHDMLYLLDDDGEIDKLGIELQSLLKQTAKTKAKDDLSDALRYAVVKIPWDFNSVKLNIGEEPRVEELFDKAPGTWTKEDLAAMALAERRGVIHRKEPEGWEEEAAEIEFWNDQYGN